MLFALFWKRCNKYGAVAGMLSGGVTIFLWKYLVRPLGGAWNIYELLPAFLVASHLASEIEKMCTHVLVLHEGEMLSFATKEEALRLHPTLEDYFLARVRDKKGSVLL